MTTNTQANGRISLQTAMNLSLLLPIFLLLITYGYTVTSSPLNPELRSQHSQQANSLTNYNSLGREKTLRQVKQTLRFGRSDPWFPVMSQEEQLALALEAKSNTDHLFGAHRRRR